MTPDSWRRVEQVLRAVMELPPDRRAATLDEACADDYALRREVESLLMHESLPQHFLTPWALEDASSTAAHSPEASGADELVGRMIGSYRVERLIASGGMGSVWLAERADGQFQQRVAVKLIRRGLDSDEFLRRFRQERQTLAQLAHPNIARLLDGGTTADERPYLVMEYVAGVPITTYCDEHALSIADRLALFREVCDAVQCAHQNLIVHRDLKPRNILVTSDGQPKLLDFGIAKVLGDPQALGRPQATATHVRLLTPEYASPEQILGEPVTTACDVYALGVILYELLTGRPPYRLEGRTLAESERIICELDPPAPSTAIIRGIEVSGAADASGEPLDADYVSAKLGTTARRLRDRLRGDLDNIVLMAMRKDPKRRYASVEQFAEDIRRHMTGLPVIARRDTLSYRTSKFLRRNRSAVGAATLVVLALVVGIAGTSWQARVAASQRSAEQRQRVRAEGNLARAEQAEQSARAEADKAQLEARKADRINTFLQEMLASANPSRKARDVTVREVLDEAAQRLEAGFDEHPEIKAALHMTIGNTYASLGLYEPAEFHLKAALAIRRDLFGSEHADVASAVNDLATLFYQRGDYAEAETLFREALETLRRVHGPVHEGVAMAMNNLAAVLRAQGQLAGAEPLYRESLAMRRELLGNEHLDVAESLNNLAGLLFAAGKHDDAESLYREALAMRRRMLGNEHPDVAQSIDNLAGVLHVSGKLDAAEPLYREALALFRRRLGDDHPDVAITLNNFAKLFIRRGDYAAAEPLFRECLRIWRAALPADHWRIAYSASVLGDCLARLERFEEAEPLLVDGYATISEALGDGDERTLWILRAMIRLYDAWGRPDKAATYRATLPKPTIRPQSPDP